MQPSCVTLPKAHDAMRRYFISERQLRGAWHFLESINRPRVYMRDALIRAGYAPSTARCPKHAVRRIDGLRESVRILADLRGESLKLPPPTKKRHQRREAVKTVLDYASPRFGRMTRAESDQLYANERKAERISQGLPLKPVRCGACGGRLEGADFYCPNCQKCERC